MDFLASRSGNTVHVVVTSSKQPLSMNRWLAWHHHDSVFCSCTQANSQTVSNPRRACAARVVLGLSFCLSVCLSVRPSVCPVPLILALRATKRPKSDTNGFSATLA